MRRISLWVIALALVVSFASIGTSNGYEGQRILAVEFDGLGRHVEHFLFLKDGLQTRTNGVLTLAEVNADAQYLHLAGYFQSVSTYIEKQDDGVIVTFDLRLYPTIQRIIVNGLESTNRDQFLDFLYTNPGHVFNRTVLEEDARRLWDWFSEQGLPMGRLASYKLTADGDLYLLVDEGRVQNVFVIVDGDRSNVLDVPTTLKEGDILSDEALTALYMEVARHSSVAEVHDVTFVQSDTKHRYDVLINVTRALTGRYEFGGGYNTADGFLLYGSVKDSNLFNSGREVGAQFRLSQRNNLFDIRYADPVLCASCWDKLTLNAYRRQGFFGRKQEHEEIRLGVEAAIHKSFSGGLAGNVGFTWASIDDTFSKYNLVTLDAGLTQQFDGGYFALDLNHAVPALGSDYAYTKAKASFLNVTRFSDLGSLHTSAQVGWLGGDNIPESEYFRIGGPGTLRGYSHSWSVGERLIVASVEYRYPLWDYIGLAAFVDVAEATMSDSSSQFGYSYGAGVRVDTPLGLLKLDYASDEHKRFKFVLGVGAEI